MLIHDSNSPGKPVTLTSEEGQHDWTASNGHPWRGFFVQDYTPRRPRVLTKHAPDGKDQVSTGDTVKLSHVWTGHTLHSHDLPYTHPGSDGLQQVTCFAGSDDNDRWLLVGDAGRCRHRPAARVGRAPAAQVDRSVVAQRGRRSARR